MMKRIARLISIQITRGLVLVMLSFSLATGQEVAEPSHESYFEKAELLSKKGLEVEAVKYYQKALNAQPNHPKYHFGLAVCLTNLKDYPEAISHFSSTLALSPDHKPSLQGQLHCYKALADKQNIALTYEKLLAIETDANKQYEYGLALVNHHYGERQYDETLRYIDQVRQTPKGQYDNELRYTKAKIYNSLGKFHKTIGILGDVIKDLRTIDPERNAKYHYELGYALMMIGDFEQAQQVLKNANHGKYRALSAKLDPEYYVSAAICYLKIDDFDRSKIFLKKALLIQENHPLAYVTLGQIAERQADQKDAIDKYKQAISMESDRQKTADTYASLTQILIDNGKYQEAIQSADAYLEITPTNDQVLFNKAIALFKLKEYQKSINILKSLTSFDRISEEKKSKYIFAMAMTYLELKEYAKAKEAFKAVRSPSFKAVANIEYEQILLKESRGAPND